MTIRERRRVLDWLYTKQGKIGDPCAYCGVCSDTWDHLPPLHFIDRISHHDQRKMVLLKIPCCLECNTLLTGLVLLTKAARRDHIKQALKKKYRKILNIPVWSEFELAEMEPKMVEDIIRHRNHANYIRDRLRFY